MNLRKVSVVLLALLLAAMAMVPMVSAATGPADQNIIGKNIPAPNALIVNSNSPPPQEQNDGVVIDNPEEYLKNWNDKMHWGLTQQQIMDDAKKLETTVLPKYRDESDKKNFEIKNLTRFSQEMGESIGLSKEQVSAYVSAHKKQLVIDHQNYLKPHDSTRISTLSTNAINAVSPGSRVDSRCMG